MGRGTWLVVVALAAIAVAAGVDALRGDGGSLPAAQPEPEPSAATTTTTNGSTAVHRFGGVLYYTDESCDLRAVALPDVVDAPAPSWNGCRFVLSPDETRVGDPGTGWDRHSDPRIGRVFQSADGVIRVATDLGPEREPVEGTAAAWKPNGTLTYFAGGAVREWPGGEVVVSQRALRPDRGGLLFPRDATRAEVKEAAWLDDQRLAAIVTYEAPSGSTDVLALYSRGRMFSAIASDPGGLTGLRVSPRGGFVAVVSAGIGPALFDRAGIGQPVPQRRGPGAIAFSPDEAWAALAADDGVYVFQPGQGSWTARLDIVANDLDWRGEADPPSLPEAHEVKDWLGGVGATGRLFVTERGCQLWALRLPELTWDDEPAGLEAPCRFTLSSAREALGESVSVAPLGNLQAVCRDGDVAIFGPGGLVVEVPNTCALAWTPDNWMTFLRKGELHRAWPSGDERRLVSREQLSEIFGRPAALEEIAWLDDGRFWAVVRSGESATVALMTTDSLVFSPSFTTRMIEGLQVNATGMVAARTNEGVVFFDSGGRRALTFPNAHAVAWAPGELYAAVATEREILLVAPISREVVSLPLEVRDLEWVVP